jgi:hypothetical protein
VLVRTIGTAGFVTGDGRKLTGVDVRPDGLIRLEREIGRTVIDPADVCGRGLERGPGQASFRERWHAAVIAG